MDAQADLCLPRVHKQVILFVLSCSGTFQMFKMSCLMHFSSKILSKACSLNLYYPVTYWSSICITTMVAVYPEIEKPIARFLLCLKFRPIKTMVAVYPT